MLLRSFIVLVFFLTINVPAMAQQELIQTPDGIFTTRETPSTLPLAKDEDSFQFIVYGDRTGGNRAGLKVLRQAVEDTNLLDPDFVLTVGDLIQGYNRPVQWQKEADEFNEIMSGLAMTWFPVAGNHDIYWDLKDPDRPRNHHEQHYEAEFGPLWYSFKHKNTGFIVLYSDEGDLETGQKGFNKGRLQNMSPQQIEFLMLALARFKDLPQVFVALHHPRWTGGGYAGSNWPEIHAMLVEAGNVKAVFAGHIHRMRFDPKDGIDYFSLATTGGHLSTDLPQAGYLHHFNVVTVRPQGYSTATIPVGAVIDPKQFKPEFLADVRLVQNMRPRRSTKRLLVNRDGTADQPYAVSISNPGKHPLEIAIVPQIGADWRAIPDHQHLVIPPGKTDGMEFRFLRTGNSIGPDQDSWKHFRKPSLEVSVDYLHESARVRMPVVTVPVDLRSALVPASEFETDLLKCLELAESRTDCARIDSVDVKVKQGPFTLEAWVYPTAIDGNRTVAAKMQSSEYGLFVKDGLPHFDVHLQGRYINPKASKKIPIKQWTHLAGIYDGKQVRLFVNGLLVASLDGSGKRTENNLPLFIGADTDGSGNPVAPFSGKLDELRLSQSVRYAGEFTPARRFTTDTDTVLLLHMDRTSGPFLHDDSTPAATVIRIAGATISDIDK